MRKKRNKYYVSSLSVCYLSFVFLFLLCFLPSEEEKRGKETAKQQKATCRSIINTRLCENFWSIFSLAWTLKARKGIGGPCFQFHWWVFVVGEESRWWSQAVLIFGKRTSSFLQLRRSKNQLTCMFMFSFCFSLFFVFPNFILFIYNFYHVGSAALIGFCVYLDCVIGNWIWVFWIMFLRDFWKWNTH